MGVGGPEEKEACPHDLGWSRMEGTRGLLARGEKWMTNQSELGGRMNAFQNLKKTAVETVPRPFPSFSHWPKMRPQHNQAS